MWVYIHAEPYVCTTGYFDPKGEWHSDHDYETKEAAAQRVHYLNGGKVEEVA